MKIIGVKLKERSYDICVGAPLEKIGPGILKALSRQSSPPKKALIISHPFLSARYGNIVSKSLVKSGIATAFALIPQGEKEKNLKTVQTLYGKCVRENLDRSSCIAAIGGGVIGDIAGFLAATYLRGIPIIHVPTTLLAMVDSSIGGKTGVDLPEAKNYVGAFHQPRLVWIEPDTLKTLPDNEFQNGLAEVIKYGIISDAKLFAILEKEMLSKNSAYSSRTAEIIALCAKIKADVVSKDERETKGLREILNFGHTWGHAIETITGYHAYKHGEAVAIGMCAAGYMSQVMGLWKKSERERMEKAIKSARLPTRLRIKISSEKIAKIITRDKKARSGEMRFVLPVKIGKVTVRKVPLETALKGLDYVQPGR